MAKETNVIALVDSALLHKIDECLDSRDRAYDLHHWYINKGQSIPEVNHQIVGHLINEVFRLRELQKNGSKK